MNFNTPWFLGNSNRPIVLLDMDDVITGCFKGVITTLNNKLGTKFKAKDITEWQISKCLKIPKSTVDEVFRTPGFFEKLKPLPGSIDVINKLIDSTKYDIYIITAILMIKSDIVSDEDMVSLKIIYIVLYNIFFFL